ncbi:hypothetical protein B0T20DRAFT_445492 [Sordaria brevicollis]|uniref:Uncharacterized protein n=1 Tax=Sordaria brevicollis TaxID=83679 RepID=A0AAE0U5J7_SORBR|nr:hypothetical protein B0T20DRAFT_445492 [Sordaria brevicollis]
MAPFPEAPPEYFALTGFRLDSDTAGRGTLSIIYTCWTAIFLASWTSFHAKCHKPGDRSRKTTWRRFRDRVIYTFFLPEVAAVWSVRDFLEAIWLCARFLVYQRQFPGWHKFTMEQAFMCIMDGIYMKMPNSDELEKVGPRDLLWLVYTKQLEYSDYPSVDEIADKNKCEWTMKFISIVETMYFVVHVIARVVLHYPVSLLEDLAAAHVFCGIIAFSFWYFCPQGIEEPFIIKPDLSKKTIPRENSRLSGNKVGVQSTIEEIPTSEAPVGWFQSMKNIVTTVTSTFAATDDTTTSVEDANEPQKIDLFCHEGEHKQIRKNVNFFRRQVISVYFLVFTFTAVFMEMYNEKNKGKAAGGETKEEKAPSTERLPSPAELKEAQIAAGVTEVCDEATGRKITISQYEGFGESFCVKQSQQLKRPNLEKIALFITFGMFAGIHLAAWKYQFVTVQERYCWRICAGTMLLGACTMLLNGPGVMGILYKQENDRKRMVSWLLPHVYTAVYILSRLGLVGVACASFREAPAGIYEVPGWTEFWPHV